MNALNTHGAVQVDERARDEVLGVTAKNTAEGFYRGLLAIRIGETSFRFSPEIIVPRLIFMLPEQPTESAPSR
jgi:hypothetical protein